MKVKTNKIGANPHRNLELNPLRPEQIEKLKESIGRTGFWDNVVVRACPSKAGFYELAYGHNRLAAVIELGIEEIDIPVRELSDWDMYLCMVDENNTQATVTTSIVYENISVGARLLEKYISESNSIEEFSKLVSGKNSARTDPYARENLKPSDFARIKNSVEHGEGVGKDLLQRFVPDAAGSNVVSTVLESIYGEARRKAAEAKAEQARKERDAQLAKEKADREAAAVAEAKRKQAEHEARVARERVESEQRNKAEQQRIEAEARAAERRAKEAEVEREAAEKRAERAAKKADEETRKLEVAEREAARLSADNLVDQNILIPLEVPDRMVAFRELVKQLGIPKNMHSEIAELAISGGWSSITMKKEIPAWWDTASGEAGRRYARIAAENKRKSDMKKYNNGDIQGFILKEIEKQKDASRNIGVVIQYLEYASPILQKNTAEFYAAEALKIMEIVKKYEALHVEKVVNPNQKMLSHR